MATRSATALAAAIRAKQISSEELLDLYLRRIDRFDGEIGAVVTIDEDGARAVARRLDADAVRGRWRGPLHGLPVTVKDALEVAGMRTTGGAVELSEHVPQLDAPAVGRLRQAGAVIFGKTNCARWSGDIQTYNDLFGTTGNPWDLTRTSGGSSGGAAAAVAAGFTAFELATDIGGSIRIPAHCCGIFGLKPTFGVVPQRGYLSHLGGGGTDVDINVVGPLARAAEDLDLLLDVLGGPQAPESTAWGLRLPPPRRAGRGWRVATWLPDDEPHHAGQRAVIEAVFAEVAALGEQVVRPAAPPLERDEQHRLFLTLLGAAISPSAPEGGRSISHRSWLQADGRRMAARRIWERWFEDHDVLLCPVMPVPAFPHDHGEDMSARTVDVGGIECAYHRLIAWTGLIGVVGLPSVVVPVGSTDGLPVGIQVVAAPYRDREAIAFAGLLATIAGAGHRVPPLVAAPTEEGRWG